jgi:mono/diheme cytochrome c family protein
VRAPHLLGLALGLLFSTLGCDDRSASTLPLWTPADHDNVASPAAGQVDTEAPRPNMPDLSQHGIDDVVLATWKQNCTSCHGLIGRGDGPQSPMFRPPDLTRPELQEGASDDEILEAIAKGRGKMPAFGHLPEDTRKGLLRLVRMLGAPKPGASPAAPPNHP